jgi:hypothetical protein
MDCSFGFRPGRSAPQALQALRTAMPVTRTNIAGGSSGSAPSGHRVAELGAVASPLGIALERPGRMQWGCWQFWRQSRGNGVTPGLQSSFRGR